MFETGLCFMKLCVLVFVIGGIRSNVLKYLRHKVPGHGWAVPMLGFGRAQQGLQLGGVCSVRISVHIMIS